MFFFSPTLSAGGCKRWLRIRGELQLTAGDKEIQETNQSDIKFASELEARYYTLHHQRYLCFSIFIAELCQAFDSAISAIATAAAAAAFQRMQPVEIVRFAVRNRSRGPLPV